jgi:hypothetical protein
MKQLGFVWAVTLAIGLHGGTTSASQPSGDNKEVTIHGCVVKGDGGYVLMDVAPETVAAAVEARTPSTPQPAGTVMPGRVLYWVNDDDDLENYAGQRVEVRGELKGEVEKGNISAEREGSLIELEFKIAGDKKVTVKVPDVPPAIGTSGTVGDKERDIPFVVRKIDVDSVKTIASVCK